MTLKLFETALIFFRKCPLGRLRAQPGTNHWQVSGLKNQWANLWWPLNVRLHGKNGKTQRILVSESGFRPELKITVTEWVFSFKETMGSKWFQTVSKWSLERFFHHEFSMQLLCPVYIDRIWDHTHFSKRAQILPKKMALASQRFITCVLIFSW